MRRWSRGFLLIDSLLSVFIVVSICMLCFSIYKVIGRYSEGYELYQMTANGTYERIMNRLPDCEACQTDESD
ncbi:MAG: hypothetical protein J5365_02235 [Erysipelotrichaceae bacterium]|nr:hypothetical protein [Erysipelotrichaceae bacterium]